ncbi:MAG TPA: M1 family aminopeptidase, partial [Thermoanaerobaculia bacterium]|nr:M1 family aminopeptidase [Thermoanaerobaculia bacterium]
YVPPRWADRARRSFGKTPEMMEYFSTVTGRPYPYAKYAQTAVADFTWGGMENITATTQTLRTLHDERAHNDSRSDSLVAHELAHQWFGDLVTCEDWSHLWLNEGMADYLTVLYLGHAGGAEEAAVELETIRQAYLREDARRYRRPIVTDRYPDPITLFDRHSYEKGALVMRMIHGLLGEEGWWKGIRAYLDRFALQTVKTSDFQSVLEKSTGVTLGPLFDQYVYGAGHPELEVRWDYQADRELVRLEVRQTQEVTGETGLFSFPVEIGLAGDVGDGGLEIQTVQILARAEQEIYLHSPARPRTVVFDPRDWVLAAVDFDKPTAEWVAQLSAAAGAAETPARLEALRALGELADAPAVEALAKALRQDPFHGARQVAAEALGQAGTEAARQALEAGAGDRDSRVRTMVLASLGNFPRDRESLPLLRRALEGDDSYKARAAAATALGRRRDAAREVTPWLVRALSQESHQEDVRAAAIEALAELDSPAVVDHAFRLAAYGAPAESRDEAVTALARIAARRQDPELRARVRRTLEGILAERDSRMREEALRALMELGDAEAIPALERTGRTDPDPELRLRAGQVIERIRGNAAAGPSGDGEGLRLRVEQLEREIDVLKARLEEAQGTLEGATGAPPPPSP